MPELKLNIKNLTLSDFTRPWPFMVSMFMIATYAFVVVMLFQTSKIQEYCGEYSGRDIPDIIIGVTGAAIGALTSLFARSNQ